MIRATLARLVVDRFLDTLPVRAVYPDGTIRGAGGPVLELVRPDALFERLARDAKIGIGEAYVAGEWRAGSDLGELLTPFAARLTRSWPGSRFRALIDRRIPHRQRNTPAGARANISAHYDLGNDLFAGFLDPTMTYSSALFDDTRPLSGQDLEEAQHRKMSRILDLAGVSAGTRVLEIGCGWGALAIAAARRGALVTGITLSAEQLELGRKRVAQAGADSVELRLQDYREVRGSFDAVVSVEMIEAVGFDFWPVYFEALDRLLAPGGTVALQAILMRHDRMLATRRSYGWIQKHVFPGGLIPSRTAIAETAARHTALRITAEHHFGPHYAETLRRWRHDFSTRDETFQRLWELYLAYSEAGFASGYLDVAHLQLRRASPPRGDREARRAVSRR